MQLSTVTDLKLKRDMQGIDRLSGKQILDIITNGVYD